MITILIILFIQFIVFIYWASSGGNQNLRYLIEKCFRKIYYYIIFLTKLRFLKHNKLYVNKHEILNGIKIINFHYIKREKYSYSTYKMHIKSIGLYEKLNGPIMLHDDFLKNMEDGLYIKCDKLEKTIKSLLTIQKFNL